MAVSNNGQGNKAMLLRQKLAHIDYARVALYGALLFLIVGGGYYGYRWHVVRREQAAQKLFADCMQEYSYAQVGQATWATVENLCKRAYEQSSNAAIAPYFLVLQSDALMYQDKKNEALALLATMLNSLSTRSPLYNVYATKRALMSLDMPDTTVQKQGLEQLTALANNAANTNRDEALYYLGLYHWSRNEVPQAQELWQKLLDLAQKDQAGMSSWALLADAAMHPIK